MHTPSAPPLVSSLCKGPMFIAHLLGISFIIFQVKNMIGRGKKTTKKKKRHTSRSPARRKESIPIRRNFYCLFFNYIVVYKYIQLLRHEFRVHIWWYNSWIFYEVLVCAEKRRRERECAKKLADRYPFACCLLNGYKYDDVCCGLVYYIIVLGARRYLYIILLYVLYDLSYIFCVSNTHRCAIAFEYFLENVIKFKLLLNNMYTIL